MSVDAYGVSSETQEAHFPPGFELEYPRGMYSEEEWNELAAQANQDYWDQHKWEVEDNLQTNDPWGLGSGGTHKLSPQGY